MVDARARTDIPGLYASGEVAYTGLHGANRMASNSLLECLVYSELAARDIEEALRAPYTPIAVPPWDESRVTQADEEVVVAHNWDEIRRCMWNYVGIVRSTKRLVRALRRVQMIQEEIADYYWDFYITSDLIELRNIATVAELIIRCALKRQESRGLHYTIDYPQTDDIHWKKDTIIRKTF